MEQLTATFTPAATLTVGKMHFYDVAACSEYSSEVFCILQIIWMCLRSFEGITTSW